MRRAEIYLVGEQEISFKEHKTMRFSHGFQKGNPPPFIHLTTETTFLPKFQRKGSNLAHRCGWNPPGHRAQRGLAYSQVTMSEDKKL